MSPTLVTMVVLLVLSEAVGIAIGEWFFRLYVSAIPPVAQSQFNAQASHMVHLLYGAGVGLGFFLWSLLGMAASAILGKFTKGEASSKA